MAEIKKAIIPIAGAGTRFLPLSKTMPKELWPLGDKPLVQYIVEEAMASGIREIIFVVPPKRNLVLDYFKKINPKIEKFLKQRKKEHLLERLKALQAILKEVSFSFVIEREPLGDGHAVLQAKKAVGGTPCAVLFSDDVVESKKPCLGQLAEVFKTCQKPVLSLHRLAKERLPFYGIVDVEKIASRLFKIKRIVEKPSADEAPSDLTITGKYILTPEVFDYLKKMPPNSRGEIILADALEKMVRDGKMVYGYEFEGEWWECGNIQAYLESGLHFSLNHPQYGLELKKFLKQMKP
jgi:UTP--glucose-1-phosphate uridylyltransferase